MTITIGELSRKTGVKVPTIRYYERSGLLAPPSRSLKAQRQYEEGDVARLRFVRHTRGLGFEMDEIKAMLEMTTGGACEEIDVMVSFIEERIATLAALRTELASMSQDIGNGLLNEALVLERLGRLDPRAVTSEEAPAERQREPSVPTEEVEGEPTGSEQAQEGSRAKRRRG